METHKGRGYEYSIQYHIVWCVKYRHKVITPAIGADLFEALQTIGANNKCSIVEFNTDLDHVHLMVDCHPQVYIPSLMKALKGVSARILMKKYGNELKKKLWGGHLWNPSYYIATVSENTEAQIREYIRSQKEK